jgi:ketosteroid isomerase-like protein
MALYSDDAILLPSGTQIVGKDKIKEHIKHIFDSAPSIHIQLMSDRTDSSGDLAFDSGTYENTLAGGGSAFGNSTLSNSVITGGGQTKTQGSYLVVAKKQTGKFLIGQQAITERPQPATGK